MGQQAVQSCVIGLDVGGTKIAGGLVQMPEGRVLARRVIPTGAGRGGDAVLRDALALAGDLRGAAEGTVSAIGVGVAELVDTDGNVTSAHTIAWSGIAVEAHFDTIAPAVVESDVRAAALAEAVLGAGRDYGLWVYITVGTGISSCLVMGGRPLPGARGNALVLASGPSTSICAACGHIGDTVLEDVASGPALVAQYNRALRRNVTRGEEVLAAASAGDPIAVDMMRSAGDALGNAVGFLVNVMDPEAVVVGGGLGQAGGLYWQSFVDSTRRHIWAEGSRGLPILHGAFGNDAGFIGAAVGAWQRLNERRAARSAGVTDSPTRAHVRGHSMEAEI